MIEIVGCLAFAIQGSDWSPPESPPYGWLCYAVDETSAESFDQIGVTKDSATMRGKVSKGDIVMVECLPYARP